MEKMKIVVISDWFSENMGYAENFLPKALAKMGHDVHLVTSTAQIYYNSPNYDKTYKEFLGKNIVDPIIKTIDNYTLHRLPLLNNSMGMPGIKGLSDYIKSLNPQIIQTFSINSISTYEAAIYCSKNKCKLFTECHIHASVFNKKNIFKKDVLKIILKRNIFKLFFDRFRLKINNKKLEFINSVTEFCYPIASDVAEIAEKVFLVPNDKIKVQSLGVDTDLFHPADENFFNKDFKEIRSSVGLDNDSLVCIYTGRFAKDKKPQCLARAVNYLNCNGYKVQALFVGNGTQEEVAEISSMKGCFVHDFVTVNNLPKFYWISDIGVWPSQESTSQLDAAACGLPLILSNKIEVMERIDGNGLLYEEDDEKSLSEQILLLRNLELRKKMSEIGVNKILGKFSWMAISKDRINDYNNSLLD